MWVGICLYAFFLRARGFENENSFSLMLIERFACIHVSLKESRRSLEGNQKMLYIGCENAYNYLFAALALARDADEYVTPLNK